MLDKRTLLLSSSYEFLSFISEKKVIKLLYKDKVESVSTWNHKIHWLDNKHIDYPAILRLKEPIKRNTHNFYQKLISFNKYSLAKRDNNECQYCGKKLLFSEITIDHVIPKSKGGKNSFLNCVISCMPCNNRKDSKTPEEAGLRLIKKPSVPHFSKSDYIFEHSVDWHPDWHNFVKV